MTSLGRGISLGVVVMATSCFIACSAQPAIVAEPPTHPRALGESEPWEEQYARAMAKRDIIVPDVEDPHHDESFNGDMQEPDERGFVGVVSDVIGFPFRAVGWLIQTLF